jgi:hypothetical protein
VAEVTTPDPKCCCGRRLVLLRMTIVIGEGIESGITRGCAQCFKKSEECDCARPV